MNCGSVTRYGTDVPAPMPLLVSSRVIGHLLGRGAECRPGEGPAKVPE
jgi:hypothetical protein